MYQHHNKGNPSSTVAALARLMESISQYHALASCVVLFYDHLLALADEVGQVYSPRTPRSLLRPRFVEDQVFLVWKEILEHVNPLIDTRVC